MVIPGPGGDERVHGDGDGAGVDQTGKTGAPDAEGAEDAEDESLVAGEPFREEVVRVRGAPGVSVWASAPVSRTSACGMRSSTAWSDVTAPSGLPGRFTMRVWPQAPEMARLSAASGVRRAPAARMRSAKPSRMRVQTARVASGVTSRGAMPVPPVVTTSCALAACARNADSMWG